MANIFLQICAQGATFYKKSIPALCSSFSDSSSDWVWPLIPRVTGSPAFQDVSDNWRKPGRQEERHTTPVTSVTDGDILTSYSLLHSLPLKSPTHVSYLSLLLMSPNHVS